MVWYIYIYIQTERAKKPRRPNYMVWRENNNWIDAEDLVRWEQMTAYSYRHGADQNLYIYIINCCFNWHWLLCSSVTETCSFMQVIRNVQLKVVISSHTISPNYHFSPPSPGSSSLFFFLLSQYFSTSPLPNAFPMKVHYLSCIFFFATIFCCLSSSVHTFFTVNLCRV